MRIWDLPVHRLCRKHLLGEHAELHAIWSILTRGKKGYASHPETARWRGKLLALYARHDEQVAEMRSRGLRHSSPLDADLAKGRSRQNRFIDTPARQRRILRGQGCECDA